MEPAKPMYADEIVLAALAGIPLARPARFVLEPADDEAQGGTWHGWFIHCPETGDDGYGDTIRDAEHMLLQVMRGTADRAPELSEKLVTVMANIGHGLKPERRQAMESRNAEYRNAARQILGIAPANAADGGREGRTDGA